ncbi:hypothetical protein GCM10027034_30000 [Ramlibacter solisilvae]
MLQGDIMNASWSIVGRDSASHVFEQALFRTRVQRLLAVTLREWETTGACRLGSGAGTGAKASAARRSVLNLRCVSAYR